MMGATQAGSMGVLGLILAGIGVYGVVSYGASQRTRDRLAISGPREFHRSADGYHGEGAALGAGSMGLLPAGAAGHEGGPDGRPEARVRQASWPVVGVWTFGRCK